VTSACHVTPMLCDFRTSSFRRFHTNIIYNSRMSNLSNMCSQSIYSSTLGLWDFGLRGDFSLEHFKSSKLRTLRQTLKLSLSGASNFGLREISPHNITNLPNCRTSELCFSRVSGLRRSGLRSSEVFATDHHPTPELSNVKITKTC
jgi:hypothetical protein